MKAATTIACRFVEAFGEPIVTPVRGTESPHARSRPGSPRASVDDIARHGIIAARARSIIALAAAQGSGELCLDGGAHHDPDDAIKRLDRSCPASARGRRTTSPCARCAGPTPSRRKTSRYATTSAASRRRRRRCCRRPGGRGEATRSCTSGAWRRHLARTPRRRRQAAVESSRRLQHSRPGRVSRAVCPAATA